MAERTAASRKEGRRGRMVKIGRVVTGRLAPRESGNLYIVERVRGGQPPHVPDRDQIISGRARHSGRYFRAANYAHQRSIPKKRQGTKIQ